MLGYIPRCVFTVFADPPAGREQEFYDWYQVVHGPDAIANGSFDALRRYRAIGPGPSVAPFLAVWEAEWPTDKDTWDYITPRANELRAQGRIGDIPSAKWAHTSFAAYDACEVDSPDARDPGSRRKGPEVRTLTTVQSEWLRADPTLPVEAWAARIVAAAPAGLWHSIYVYSGDPAADRGGWHLALFESSAEPAEVQAAWRSAGAAGTAPVPSFVSRFEDHPEASTGTTVLPGVSERWVMHWQPVAELN